MHAMILLTCVTASGAAPVDADRLHSFLVEMQDQRTAEGAPLPTRDDVARSLDGKTALQAVVVDGYKAHKGYGVRTYPQPIEQVWRAVNDTPHLTPYTAIGRSETVQGTARQGGRYTWQHLPLPLVKDRWWVAEAIYNQVPYDRGLFWEMSWHDRTADAASLPAMKPGMVDAGVPVAFARGAWMLVDLGEQGTWAQYYVWTDPGGALPKTATNRFALSAVNGVLESVETFLEEHVGQCDAQAFLPDGSPL